MKRTSIVIVLSLAIVFIAAAQTPFKLVPPDKSFEIIFPGEPNYTHEASAPHGIHAETRTYSFKISEANSVFTLSCVDFTPAPVYTKIEEINGLLRMS